MFDGTKLDGPVSLRQAILSHSDAFIGTFTENLLAYGLGRVLDYRRHAGGARDRARGGAERQPVFVVRSGHREEHAVPDETGGRRGDAAAPESSGSIATCSVAKSVKETQEQCSSPRSIFRGARFFAAWACRWRCRCSIRWCRRRRRSRKTAAAPQTRLACIEMVHGAAGSTVDGIEQALLVARERRRAISSSRQTLEPLEPFRDYLTIVSDTDLHPAGALSAAEEGADHFRSSAVFLTAAHPKMTEGADISCGTSIDQMYAQQFGQDTPLPSIQLCIESVDRFGRLRLRLRLRLRGHDQLGVADAAAADDDRPAHGVREPVRRRRRRRKSGARGSRSTAAFSTGSRTTWRTLQKGLGPSDRSRLNDYLDDVREIERRIQKIEKYNSQRRGASAAGGSDRRAGFVRRARQADVRSAGAGVHDRHHARLGVQDEPRRQPARLPGERREDAVPSAARITARARPRSRSSPSSTGITSAWCRISWTS